MATNSKYNKDRNRSHSIWPTRTCYMLPGRRCHVWNSMRFTICRVEACNVSGWTATGRAVVLMRVGLCSAFKATLGSSFLLTCKWNPAMHGELPSMRTPASKDRVARCSTSISAAGRYFQGFALRTTCMFTMFAQHPNISLGLRKSLIGLHRCLLAGLHLVFEIIAASQVDQFASN